MKCYIINSAHLKNLMMLTVLALFTTVCAADTDNEKEIFQKDLPAAVNSAFQTAYPSAKIKHISMETDSDTTFYEIACKDGKTKRSVVYLADGKLYEVESKIHVKDLPAAVINAITMKYPQGKLKKAEIIIHGAGTTYEVVVKNDGGKLEVVLDPNGKILLTEEITDEEEDD